MADGPVAYYRLSEASGSVAANAVGDVFAGTYEGGVTHGVPSLCGDDGDTACALNGTSGAIQCGQNNSDLRFPGNFTYEAIVRPATTGTFGTVLSHGYSGPCLRINTAGRIEWLRSHQALMGTGAAVLEAGQRYHVLAAVQANGATAVYVNGALDMTPTAWNAYSGATRLLVGADAGGDGVLNTFFAGVVDEVAIYDKALSGARALAHAQAAGLA